MDTGLGIRRTASHPGDAARVILSRLRWPRLRDRVALVVLAVAVVIAALVSAIVVLTGSERQSQAATGRAWAAETSLTRSSLALAEQRTVMHGYLLTRAPPFLDRYRASREEALRRSGDLVASAASAGVGTGPLQAAVGAWQAWADSIAGLPSDQVTASDLERGDHLYGAVVAQEIEVERRLDAAAAGAQAESGRRSVLLTAAAVGAGVLLVGLLLFLWWEVGASTLRPIDRLVEAARAIGSGGASEIPDLDRRDELGQLAHALAAWRRESERRIDRANAAAAEKARRADALDRLNEVLMGTNDELAAANRRRRDFLASLSHELRTPLSAILGLSRVLLETDVRAMDPARLARLVRHIHDSGQRLLGMTNDVLDLAKVEAGRTELRAETIDLAAAISAALQTMEPLADQGGIELSASLPRRLPVCADRDMVQHMLLNLVSNAIKFTPRGGHVTVTVQRRPGRVIICVADTGIGIAEHDHERVFEEFHQLHPTGGARSPSSGLGLTLTRRWAELHGGRTWVESELGRGSRFFIELPAPRQQRSTAPGTLLRRQGRRTTTK